MQPVPLHRSGQVPGANDDQNHYGDCENANAYDSEINYQPAPVAHPRSPVRSARFHFQWFRP